MALYPGRPRWAGARKIFLHSRLAFVAIVHMYNIVHIVHTFSVSHSPQHLPCIVSKN